MDAPNITALNNFFKQIVAIENESAESSQTRTSSIANAGMLYGSIIMRITDF